MKKNDLPLSDKHLSRLYWEISQKGSLAEGVKYSWPYDKISQEELWCLAFLMARYDPRLMAILVHYFLHHEPSLDPVLFKAVLRKHEALPIAAVIGEYIKEGRAPFTTMEFFKYLSAGVKPSPLQLFYRNLYFPSSKKMDEVLSKPLWAFKKWGFLAGDPPLLKEEGKRMYLYDYFSRHALAKELAGQKTFFKLGDYLKAISHSVSRQQALKDLRSFAFLKKSGMGKGRVYARKDRDDAPNTRIFDLPAAHFGGLSLLP